MDRTRIRWRNAARIGAGLAAAGGLVLVLPSLLEPPQPRPLPADIGLATAPGDTPEPVAPPAPREASREGSGARKMDDRQPAADPAEGRRGPARERANGDEPAPRGGAPTTAAPAPAAAATCRFTDLAGFPAIHGGQVYGLSCATARAIGNKIQAGVAQRGSQPTRLRAHGMRFRCRYRFYTEGDGQLQRAICRRAAKPEQRAVLKLSA